MASRPVTIESGDRFTSGQLKAMRDLITQGMEGNEKTQGHFWNRARAAQNKIERILRKDREKVKRARSTRDSNRVFERRILEARAQKAQQMNARSRA